MLLHGMDINMKDIVVAVNNWRRMIIIESDADLSAPAVKKNIENIEKAADKALREFTPDAEDSLFLGRLPLTSADMTQEYARIWSIGKSYGSYGTKHYHKQEILEILLYCLEWMYDNRYGQKEIDGIGWRDMNQFNWYDWSCASPELIIDTLIVLGDRIPLEDRKKYLKVFDYRVPIPRDYACNKVHFEKCCIGSGLLQENEEKIYAAISACEDTNIYVDGGKNDGQGFYTDGSYIFHTRHPMNGTYGLGHAEYVMEICKILKGTKFADPKLEKKLCEWAENAFVPFLSKTLLARRIMGREPFNCRTNGLRTLEMICEVATFTEDPYYKKVLLQAVKRNITANPEMMSDERVLTDFYACLSTDAEALIRTMNDNKDFAVEEYNINKIYHNEDIVIHHNKGVSYALGMSSSRIYNYECINHENQDGWYLGDGTLTAFADDFYAYYADGSYDNPYRHPGTTVDDRERAFISIAQGNEYLSSQDFVGGVSDGVSGIGAMQLESYYGTGELVYRKHHKPTGEYGDAPEKRESTLLAKKSYFFNGINAVCLGADISAQDNANVITVIDNRKTNKSIKTVPHGLYLDGFGGYYFPENMNVTVSRGGKENAYLEIVAHHGMNPINASYAYQILPRMSKRDLEIYVNAPDFTILANNREVQAVSFEDGKQMYVFWTAGSFEGIEVSAPCMVLISSGKIYLSEPTHKLERVTVKIENKEYIFNIIDKHGETHVKNM